MEYKEKEKQAVYEKFIEHHGSFGRRRMKKLLEADGISMSEHKVSNIMKELGVQSKYGRKKCNTALALEVLEKAVAEYGTPDMIMTDRGAQFTCKDFFDTMQKLSVVHSMSRPYKLIDNRYIETFWKSMKVEMGKLDLLNEQTYRMVVDYYIYYYNNLRPHSSLAYRTPLAA